MDAPIRYAKSRDVNVAFQVTGEGPFDLVLISGFVSHLEYDWRFPSSARLLERLGSFARLIRFDKRGTGLSDRAVGLPDFETRMDDVRAVMDAADSDRAALFGYSEGGPLAILFAATYPERVRALVLYGPTRNETPRITIMMNSRADVRQVLSAVQAPTLVVHRRGDRDARIEEGRYIAAHLPVRASSSSKETPTGRSGSPTTSSRSRSS